MFGIYTSSTKIIKSALTAYFDNAIFDYDK